MTVPARPVSGEPVATAWGEVVHDTIVDQDLQTGSGTITTTSGAGSASVTFPRAFASAPAVFVTITSVAGATAARMVRATSISASGFTCNVLTTDAANPITAGDSIPFTWLAYGERA